MVINREKSSDNYNVKSISRRYSYRCKIVFKELLLSVAIIAALASPVSRVDANNTHEITNSSISNNIPKPNLNNNNVIDAIYKEVVTFDVNTIDFDELYSFLDLNNKLNSKGYNPTEMIMIFNTLSKKDIESLSNSEFLENVTTYIEYNNFKGDNIDRYILYQEKNNNLSEYEIITAVNLRLDFKEYEEPVIISNPGDNLALVSRRFALPTDYVPEVLYMADSREPVLIPDLSRDNKGLKPEVHESLWALTDYLKEELGDKAFIVNYAFRSYDEQSEIFDRNYKKNPMTALSFVARPGHSEHQTGRAIDIEALENFDSNYQFLADNAHEYGFILHYQSGTKNITGYGAEPWHITFVGKDAATYVYENKITYEQYYATVVDVRSDDYGKDKFDINKITSDINTVNKIMQNSELVQQLIENGNKDFIKKCANVPINSQIIDSFINNDETANVL